MPVFSYEEAQNSGCFQARLLVQTRKPAKSGLSGRWEEAAGWLRQAALRGAACAKYSAKVSANSSNEVGVVLSRVLGRFTAKRPSFKALLISMKSRLKSSPTPISISQFAASSYENCTYFR